MAAPGINGLNANPPTVAVTLLDSTGTIAFTSNLRGGSMGAGIGGSFTGPYKLRLSVATKTKDVTLPFELKDLPLPEGPPRRACPFFREVNFDGKRRRASSDPIARYFGRGPPAP